MQSVACPYCRKLLANDGSLAGQAVACPLCGGRFRMPPAVPQPAQPSAQAQPQTSRLAAGPAIQSGPAPAETTAAVRIPRPPAAAAPPVASSAGAAAAGAQFLPRPESVSESLYRQVQRRRHSPVTQVGIVLGVLFVLLGIAILIGTYLWLSHEQDSPWYREGYRVGREVGEVARFHRWSYNPFPSPQTLRRIKGLPGPGTREYKYFCDGYRCGYEETYYGESP